MTFQPRICNEHVYIATDDLFTKLNTLEIINPDNQTFFHRFSVVITHTDSEYTFADFCICSQNLVRI